MVGSESLRETSPLFGIQFRYDLGRIDVVFASRRLALEEQLQIGREVRNAVARPEDGVIPGQLKRRVAAVHPAVFGSLSDREVEHPRTTRHDATPHVVLLGVDFERLTVPRAQAPGRGDVKIPLREMRLDRVEIAAHDTDVGVLVVPPTPPEMEIERVSAADPPTKGCRGEGLDDLLDPERLPRAELGRRHPKKLFPSHPRRVEKQHDAVRLRWMTADDSALVAEAEALFDYPVRRPWMARFLESLNHHLCVAYIEDAPAGFVSGVETMHPDKGTEMLLYELGVDEPYRQRGVGHALVEALADRARDLGCYGMWVLTDADNLAAVRTYEGAGAVIEGEQLMLSWRFDPEHEKWGGRS